jgi:hypothetical protein
MVDQLFTNVDVTGAIQQQLPPNLQAEAMLHGSISSLRYDEQGRALA